MLGHFFSVLFSSHVLEIVCIRRIQSVTRASQRKSTPETRRDCSRAPRDLAKRDAMIGSTTNTRHHFKSAPFLLYFSGSSRANTSVDGVARVPSISRGETTRQPSWSGHTYLDNARDATETNRCANARCVRCVYASRARVRDGYIAPATRATRRGVARPHRAASRHRTGASGVSIGTPLVWGVFDQL